MSPDGSMKMNQVANIIPLKTFDMDRVDREMNNNEPETTDLIDLMNRARLSDSLNDLNDHGVKGLPNGNCDQESSKSTSTESLNVDCEANDNSITTKNNADESSSSIKKEVPIKQFRSMSDSSASPTATNSYGDIIVFPSLQDNILETMGLLGDGPREILSEEEIENKFQKLALAFAIDALTLTDRKERQRRQRDQAEENMSTEVTKLINAIHRLNPLCIDAEKTELVSSLLVQLDVILQASIRISTAAEIFGSVQQEWRLTEAVTLMQNHLRNLKQQRDTVKKQLQCTKRLLQDTASVKPSNSTNNLSNSCSNNNTSNRRRASVATMSRAVDYNIKSINRSSLRRRVTGDRLWLDGNEHLPSTSAARHSRMDLGMDTQLVKIKEGIIESTTEESDDIFENDADLINLNHIPDIDITCDSINNIVEEKLTVRERIAEKVKSVGNTIERKWNTLVDEGIVHEYCCFGAIICFALCTIILSNIAIELLYAKRGPLINIPWNYMKWDKTMGPFLNLHYEGQPPL